MTPLFIQNIGLPGMLLIAIVVLVLFGRGRISNMMGEVGKGITAFRSGIKEGSETEEEKNDVIAEHAKDITPKKKRAATKKPAAKKTTKKKS